MDTTHVAQPRSARAPGSATNPAGILAIAGIAGPVLFTAGFLVQELFRREEYNPLAEPVSALEAGPNGWVQQVNFAVFGLLVLGYAVGLHRGVRASGGGRLGPALIGLSGLGLLIAAAFPLREDAAGLTYDPGGHVVGGLSFFLGSALGLIVLSRRLARDPRWRSLAGYALTAGCLALAGFVLMATLVMPDDAPLHEWAGLGQRLIILVVLFPCQVVLGTRLLKLSRRGR